MWIMLTTKLPTRPSPPKLAIFWSEPWIDEGYVIQQFRQLGGIYPNSTKRRHWSNDELFPPEFYTDENNNILNDELLKKKIIVWMQTRMPDLYKSPLSPRGIMLDHNWSTARSILYKGEKIRVFANEFAALTHENMSQYIGMTGEAASHELVPDSVSSAKIIDEVLTGSLKEVYDAALVDGCSHAQAVAMALGIEIEEPVSETDLATFPATGWYRCRREYAQFFCEDYELEE